MAVTVNEVVRLVHVLSAVLWFGGMVFGIAVVGPSVKAAGDAGKAFMGAVMRRGGFGRYMGPLGILTLLSGLALYWGRSYLDAPFANGPTIAVTLGAILALVGVGASYAINLPLQRRMKELSGGAPTPAQAHEMATLGGRMAKAGIVMVTLMSIVIFLMVGRNLFA